MNRILLAAFLFLTSANLSAEITGIVTFPGGSDGEVQYQDDGVFEGDPSFTFNGTTVSVSALSVGTLSVTSFSAPNISATYGVSAATGVFSGALSAATLNTGQGANELYDMDQNVQTTDSPSFTGLTVSGLTSGRIALTTTGGALTTDADFTQNGTTATLSGVSATNISVSGNSSLGTALATSITDSGLTNTRITFSGTGGLLQDDADMTFNGTTATISGLSVTNASLSGNLTVNGTALTATELSYVDSASSNLQAQINAITPLAVATQAQMETGTSTTTAVSPGRAQYSPGSAKAWVVFNGTGTVSILASYNVSSITDNGTGSYDINFTTSFSSANYAFTCSAGSVQAGDTGTFISAGLRKNASPTSSVFPLSVWYESEAVSDVTRVSCVFFGDQ